MVDVALVDDERPAACVLLRRAGAAASQARWFVLVIKAALSVETDFSAHALITPRTA